MDIIFKGRQTDVPARFREYATAKLNRLEKLDSKALRVDVELSVERNPRLASQKERVELTIRSRGPAIRAEAAADDRLAALDLALAKLDSRLRRALDRRKNHQGGRWPYRLVGQRAGEPEEVAEGIAVPGQRAGGDEPGGQPGGNAAGQAVAGGAAADGAPAGPPPGGPEAEAPGTAGTAGGSATGSARDSDSVVPIEMEGDGPLVVRQKFHHAGPISIDQALLEMELVGHDFYLFHDIDKGMPSVVYRRRGYQYGVIRLVGNTAAGGQRAADGDAAQATGAATTVTPR